MATGGIAPIHRLDVSRDYLNQGALSLSGGKMASRLGLNAIVNSVVVVVNFRQHKTTTTIVERSLSVYRDNWIGW
jgi:hypothetical protein